MEALNLYTLTRIRNSVEFSKLEEMLSGRSWYKAFSPHEVSSLCALVDVLATYYEEEGGNDEAAYPGWVSFFDGFYFSYTIEHISKEFDLLKLSPGAGYVLNIELKSESIEEERIRKQLEQNRYYLSHISRTTLSYTYVMETNALYCLNDHGFLKKCPVSELAKTMKRPALREYVRSDIHQFFRAQDYLISPVKTPEKFLTGRYFLTNQQSEFRRQILDILSGKSTAESGGEEAHESVPVISLTGSAGTGKTLLLFDLARALSKKRKVLFLHGGPLREGHHLIDSRLHKVRVLSGTDPEAMHALFEHMDLSAYCVMLVDEANRFSSDILAKIFRLSQTCRIPCVFSYDPHSILGPIPPMEDAEAVIAGKETLRLELSGNIRINRPIFSFLRTLFHKKDRPGHFDYSCIDVLYAADRKEERALTGLYLNRGYQLIHASHESFRTGEIISQEFDKVFIILDRRFYYDENQNLCAEGPEEAAIPLLYEGLSRAREKLCLVIVENKELFSEILAIRLDKT